MKAQELRIGNYVKDNEGILLINGFKPFEHSVRCDEDEGCALLIDIIKNGNIDKGYECDLDSVKPIPLTEEILLKCGFVAKNIYDDFYLNGVRLQSTVMRCDTNERSSFFLYLGEENEVFNNRIDSLHQLQNLYFALTNEDLEIKL